MKMRETPLYQYSLAHVALGKFATPPFDILELKEGTFRIRVLPCIIVDSHAELGI